MRNNFIGKVPSKENKIQIVRNIPPLTSKIPIPNFDTQNAHYVHAS